MAARPRAGRLPRDVYFCAFGLVVFLPFAYAICQVLTYIVYEGRWRRLCLLPIPFFLAGFTPLIYWHEPAAFVLTFVGAPAIGFVALACVWGLYSKSPEAQATTGDGSSEG